MTLHDKLSNVLWNGIYLSPGGVCIPEGTIYSVLDLIRDNITIGEWHCSDGETLKYQDRLFVYSIYPNNLGEFTLDDGESVKSYPTVVGAKAAALGHKRDTIMSEIGG